MYVSLYSIDPRTGNGCHMHLTAAESPCFRLVLTIDQCDVVYLDRRFPNFREAQSCVADAVCSHFAAGRVESIRMERAPARGRPSAGASTNARPGEAGDWSIEKRWGRDVVARILAQRGLLYPTPTLHVPAPAASTDHTDPPTRGGDKPSGADDASRPTRPGHRPTRWDLMTTAALLVTASVGFFVVHTEGRPQDAFSYQADAPSLVSQSVSFDGLHLLVPDSAAAPACGSPRRIADSNQPRPVDRTPYSASLNDAPRGRPFIRPRESVRR